MTAALAAVFAFVKGDWRLILLIAIAAALGVVAWRIYAAGAASEVARQDKAALAAQRERVLLDEEIAHETDYQLCVRLGGGGACRGLR